MHSIISITYRSIVFFIVFVLILASCRNKSAEAQRTVAAKIDILSAEQDTVTVSEPPPSLHFDPFYKKWLDASGIPIIGSEKVPDEAFVAVKKMMNEMLSMREDVRQKLIENKLRVGIMAKTEVTTDLPECRDWNTLFPETNWNTRGRGYGASVEYPISTCAEENILCYGEGVDSYAPEDIFIHEFAHSIYALGITYVDTTIDEELKQIYDDAIAHGLWKNTYAASNMDEYFAEGVQDWYNINDESIPSNGIHNEINTREELKAYDPGLYAFIKRYFRETDKKISCHRQL